MQRRNILGLLAGFLPLAFVAPSKAASADDELNSLIDQRIAQRLEGVSQYPPNSCVTVDVVKNHLARTIAALKGQSDDAEPIDVCELTDK